MAVELAEVAAGLPFAASLALAGGITTLREGRRRAALNEAMHELRRPLQVLTLALPGEAAEAAPVQSSLHLTTLALERLDREINGVSLEEAVGEVSVRDLADEAVRRWRPLAVRAGHTVEVDRNGEELWVEGNRFDLAQALDNLLSNAIEHGSGSVRIGWRREGGWVEVSVTDSGASPAARRNRRRPRRGGRCRRGHGLRVVGRIARRHGGSFALCRTRGGAEARLRLPLRREGGER
jgi:signal transduction histidine kinase